MWFGDEHLVEVDRLTVDSAIVFGCTQPMTKTTIIASLSLFSSPARKCYLGVCLCFLLFSASVSPPMCGQPFGIYCYSLHNMKAELVSADEGDAIPVS